MRFVRGKREAIGLAVIAVLAVAWFLGVGDHTPSRQDAEAFLAYSLKEAESIVGFHESGKVARLTAALVARIDEVECHHDTSSRKWFQRYYHPNNYDCIYRLAGSDGARYLTLISANYTSSNEFASYKVGHYGLGYRDEAGQRAELAKHGINLPATN